MDELTVNTLSVLFNALCNELENPNTNQILTFIIVKLIPDLCQEISKDTSLSGEDKKTLVISAIRQILADGANILDVKFPQDETWVNFLLSLTNDLVPQTIDLLISISNGVIKLEPKLVDRLKRFFSCKK